MIGFITYWAPLLGLGVSAAYFFASPKGESWGRKMITCSHGAFIALLYLAVMFRCWGYERRAPALALPFNLLVLLGLVLLILPLILFRGPKLLHLLQLLNLVLLAWTWFMGGMAITGDYL